MREKEKPKRWEREIGEEEEEERCGREKKKSEERVVGVGRGDREREKNNFK
jgi:hypothetical protein